MNNNNNQNMNNGIGVVPQPMGTPNPNPNIGTIPAAPVGTIPTPQAVPQAVPQAAPMNTVPPVPNNNMTQPVQNNGIAQPIPQPMPNLQPEGMVSQIPAAPQPVQPQPLMSTPLTAQTNLNMNAPGTSVPQPTPMQGVPNPNMNMNMGMNTMPTPNAGVNQMNMVGGVPMPPPITTPPEGKGKAAGGKKKPNKILIILLIVLLIAGVGFGVYYYLVMSKANAIVVTPLASKFELGNTVDTKNPMYYVTVSGMSITACTVDKTTVDMTKVGTYEYSVTCGKKTVSGEVSVQDTTAPTVYYQDLAVVPGTEVDVKDFITGVIDASTYTVKNLDGETIDTSAEGEIQVNIQVSDAYENQTIVVGNLTVSENAPVSYLSCSEENVKNTINATYTHTYKFGITSNDEMYNARQIAIFKFKTEDDYTAAVSTLASTSQLEGITGNPMEDSKNLTITFNDVIESTVLETTFKTSPFPTTSTDIQALFPNGCKTSDK